MFTQLVWLVPLFPLLGFIINGLGFGKISKRTASFIGCGMVALSFITVLAIFFEYLSTKQTTTVKLYDWIVTGSYKVSFSFMVDALTLNMLLIVTGVGLLIHIYSAGYMKEDEGFGKFFAYLNLFMFSMLILVLGSNYVMMFIGWEGVGLCSYLLIGFWFKVPEYTAAANKAFIMNRIGDLGFLLGIFLIFITFGTSEYTDVFSKAGSFNVGDGVITAITLLLFVGAVGKSAQIPLYTWLPDAMAGPTPVSALIHAATMVTAGVYMCVRSNILYSLAPFTSDIILWIGVFTALLAALIALTQNDIKKVLAYSTVSQLGYMFASIGAMGYSSAMFHVTTHAFFKALLFLGAGSVIHAMGGEQNMRHFGGLRKKLPVTYTVMLIATMAITGVPLLSGFFSKDEILLAVQSHDNISFLILAFTSVLTTFYMFRLLFMTFFGDFRGKHEQEHHLHESPRIMTMPLIILAVLSVVGGYIGLPHVTGAPHIMANFLNPVFADNHHISANEASTSTELTVMGVMTLLVFVVIYYTNIRYAKNKVVKAFDVDKKPFYYKLSYHKFYVDELFDNIIVKPVLALSDGLYKWIDRAFIDGIINGGGRAATLLSGGLRRVQTGNIGFYVIAMVTAIVVIISFVILKIFIY